MVETRPEDLEPGDEFVFNGGTQPCTVEESYRTQNARYDGSIRVIHEVIATGPEGADIRIQRTGTGRVRVQPSSHGPFANVESLKRVATASSGDNRRRERLATIADSLFDD